MTSGMIEIHIEPDSSISGTKLERIVNFRDDGLRSIISHLEAAGIEGVHAGDLFDSVKADLESRYGADCFRWEAFESLLDSLMSRNVLDWFNGTVSLIL